MAEVARTGTVRQLPGLPADVRAAFVTALEVASAWHLKMQAAVRRHVDAAVAKTINLPADATPADVRAIYLAAWRAGVKGITVYRYGARPGQVLTLAAARHRRRSSGPDDPICEAFGPAPGWTGERHEQAGRSPLAGGKPPPDAQVLEAQKQ